MDDTDWSLISFEDPKKAGALKIASVSQAERDRRVTQMVEHVRNHDILASVKPSKGVCPKCSLHIGRGLHFHVKACVGK